VSIAHQFELNANYWEVAASGLVIKIKV